MAIKKIRVPLTDIYGNDISTGKKIDLSKFSKEVDEKQKEMQVEITKRIQNTKREDGKVFVNGFGRVAY